ncbi:hypothetical protein IFM89_038745 [Coptis chinensis]|uniref:C3H1-type domain-containing protein n=1 Tax=Coptis chinensis TaxID=261450 RepID=A0A835HFB1_9MAGN|nr:hypothetical protein IFM89_038745 [Coptis chinensis]
MWDKFGGYLLLFLGLTAKAERVQDEVRLRLFLDNIGFSDLSAKKIKKWMPEDRRQFELVQEKESNDTPERVKPFKADPAKQERYIRLGNGNQLVRDPKKLVRLLASEKIRWSLHTSRLRLARKQQYCQFFTRFEKCNKGDGKCPYIHDPDKIAVCTKFLKGLCSNPSCKLTHKVIPERMPDCSYFLQDGDVDAKYRVTLLSSFNMLRSSLWLQFKPHHIAAGAAYLAKILNFDLATHHGMWQEFQTTPSICQDVVKRLMRALLERNYKIMGSVNFVRIDEVCLRLFLDNIGFSGLSAKKIKKWMPEDRRQFELVQERGVKRKGRERKEGRHFWRRKSVNGRR